MMLYKPILTNYSNFEGFCSRLFRLYTLYKIYNTYSIPFLLYNYILIKKATKPKKKV